MPQQERILRRVVIESGVMGGLDQMGQMRKLLADNKERIGREFDIVQVGEAGYVLQPKHRKPRAYTDWIGFDVDDTILASSQVKGIRKKAYGDYLRGLGVSINQATVDELMDETYAYVQGPVGMGNYFTDNHIRVLDLATSQLQGATEAQISGRLEGIRTTLVRIRRNEALDTDPFTIEGYHLVPRNGEPPSPDIQKIFQYSLLATPQFDEVVDAVVEVGRAEEVNVGLFTLGDPPEQLVKICKLLIDNPQMEVDQIWITNVPKDQFIKTMIELGVQEQLAYDYANGHADNGGRVFGNYPHVMVAFDDSIASANTLHAANAVLEARKTEGEEGAEIVVVRARRTGTKDGHKDWDGEQIDFRYEAKTGADIAKTLQRVRSENLQRRFKRVLLPGQRRPLEDHSSRHSDQNQAA